MKKMPAMNLMDTPVRLSYTSVEYLCETPGARWEPLRSTWNQSTGRMSQELLFMFHFNTNESSLNLSIQLGTIFLC